ncbi:MAG: T9SS type A sorting domain-containing protein, partial [Bacteroidota bacterium]
LFTVPAEAQWECLYATYDASNNGTGSNTPSVGVISEDMFVALLMTPNIRNYMIPYVNADSANGRVNFAGYGSGSTAVNAVFQFWTDGGFDQVEMRNAVKIVATPDSTIYVASNDAERHILIFKFTGDTVETAAPYRRQPTGTNSIFGIAVDGNGYVYVSHDTTTGLTNDIKIYKPISQWSDAHNDQPVSTVDLPDGIYRGIVTSPDGSTLFVSDFANRRILKFTGSPTTGYVQDNNFQFQLGEADTVAGTTQLPVPINLAYLASNNILFAAVDVHGYSSGTHGTYTYGRIYLLNPFTGALVSEDSSLSIIDAARWNIQTMGTATNRGDGTLFGNASGYTSTYDVAFDEKGNLYTQSHFGWTVDKWRYNGTLPTVTKVEQISGALPQSFELGQNYPNPFNPVTTILFNLHEAGFVTLKVHDLLGREVATLAEESLKAGAYQVKFDSRDLPGGTYFYT